VCVRVCMCVCVYVRAILAMDAHSSFVCLQIPPIDAARTSVTGPGTIAFAVDDTPSTQNIITVKAFNRRGRPVVLMPALIQVKLSHTGAGGEAAGIYTSTFFADGTAMISYIVRSLEFTNVSIELLVRGISAWCGVVPKRAATFKGVHQQTYAIHNTSTRRGLAVSGNGQLMAVSSYGNHCVDLYSLVPTFHHLRKLGSKGPTPGQFSEPRFVCFTSRNTLLVCDNCNNRVQELNIDGSYIRSIVVQNVWSVVLHDDLLVVGCRNSTVSLFSFSSGALIRTFGSVGDGPGQIKDMEGISFTRDCQYLLVAESSKMRVSMFTAAGDFVKHIGVGALSSNHKDVAVLHTGQILVTDGPANRLCLFSPDGDTLVSTIGSEGTADGQFKFPTALAVHGSRVFVLDNASPRVQVFE
jgi:WD40 repeat protein